MVHPEGIEPHMPRGERRSTSRPQIGTAPTWSRPTATNGDARQRSNCVSGQGPESVRTPTFTTSDLAHSEKQEKMPCRDEKPGQGEGEEFSDAIGHFGRTVETWDIPSTRPRLDLIDVWKEGIHTRIFRSH
jgi:hypothetical protein